MLNIVVPMAGLGSRFIKAGYQTPKPFIDVDGIPMILRVVNNLTPMEPYRFIFLARRDHEDYIRQHMSFATNVIYVDEVTEGAACTVLLAKELINNEDSLIIANSDQLVRWNDKDVVRNANGIYWKESNNIQDMLNEARSNMRSGSIATFHATHPKWSYAQVGNNGLVMRVAEKKVISNLATVGIYYYRHGRLFVTAAERMIEKDVRVNNEFYVCPVFNEMIESAQTIGVYPVKSMVGLGTPEDLNLYKLKRRSL